MVRILFIFLAILIQSNFASADFLDSLKKLTSSNQSYSMSDGYDFYNKGDYKKAFEIFLKLSENGDPAAMGQLGYMYGNGIGVARNPVNAFNWLKKANDILPGGNDNFNLGYLYENGIGTNKNLKKALESYKKAKQLGIKEPEGKDNQTLSKSSAMSRMDESIKRLESLIKPSSSEKYPHTILTSNNPNKISQVESSDFPTSTSIIINPKEIIFEIFDKGNCLNGSKSEMALCISKQYNSTIKDRQKHMAWFIEAKEHDSSLNASAFLENLSHEWRRSGGKERFLRDLTKQYKHLESMYPYHKENYQKFWSWTNKNLTRLKDKTLLANNDSNKDKGGSFSELWNQNGGEFVSKGEDQSVIKFQKSTEDTIGPLLALDNGAEVEIFDANHTISGRISDKSGLAELRINGQSVIFNDDGKFNKKLYFAIGNNEVNIEVFDTFGNKTTRIVSISRKQPIVKNTDKQLVPPTKRIYKNPNAVAVLVGLEKYENMPEAQWAESDAKIFYDYAKNVLGVSEDRIRILVNENSKYIDFWDNLEFWLNSKVFEDETDIYFYFAGHGLVSEDGLNTYLMPYDARTNLLNRTAISRKEVINFLDNLNPRSATLFLDTCYSGNAKGGAKTLVASRGLRVVKKDQIDNIPSNFTIFSAASSDETAISHPTQKNGLFSYWLMRGMDGEADLNKDEKITNAELQQYVNQKVVKTAIAEGQKQTPQMYGNNERVITRW